MPSKKPTKRSLHISKRPSIFGILLPFVHQPAASLACRFPFQSSPALSILVHAFTNSRDGLRKTSPDIQAGAEVYTYASAPQCNTCSRWLDAGYAKDISSGRRRILLHEELR